MLEHQDAVGGGYGNSAAGAAFTDDDRNDGDANGETAICRAGDGLALPPLLSADAGIRARRIDHREHRRVVTIGQFYEPAGLALALRASHPEIWLHPCFGFGSSLRS